MTYTIRTTHFEGPFDLLLFFIERDELDIYDIPIAKITDDFLTYIREMESLNIDLAGEFILVAATLMRIKAKMLLPRKELDEQGNEIDPRQELVERLLEYRRYKDVIDDLRAYEERRSQAVGRGNVADELQKIANEALADAELESLTMFRLLKAFERVMERFEEHRRVVHTIVRYPYTVLQQQNIILERLTSQSKLPFEGVFMDCENRVHAIVTFLALLELLNVQRIHLTQGIGNNNFWINLREDWDGEEEKEQEKGERMEEE
ncbi:MAG TPA: segregation/condensation protein A [Saprospiraceae bacterium]|nr:segregation/condensation protein A [Saprospiraceae bacterium]